MIKDYERRLNKARDIISKMSDDKFKNMLIRNGMDKNELNEIDDNPCEYCKESAFNTLIENEDIGSLIYMMLSTGYELDIKDIEDCNEDNSVILQIVNNAGYIRLGDKQELGCLDHGLKFKINYCPMCGRKLGE